MILGLTGLKRHGKGTAAGVLVAEYGFVQIDFTDALNDMLMVLDPIVGEKSSGFGYMEEARYSEVIEEYGYDQAKDVFPEIVRLLQKMGTDVGRNMIDPDLWIHQWARRVVPLVAEGKDVVVSNIRFDNEARIVAGIAGEMGQEHQIWLCVRPGYIHDTEAHKHISERGIHPDFIKAEINATTVLENQARTRTLIEHTHNERRHP